MDAAKALTQVRVAARNLVDRGCAEGNKEGLVGQRVQGGLPARLGKILEPSSDHHGAAATEMLLPEGLGRSHAAHKTPL